MILAWAIVPWLWSRQWPPRFSRDWFFSQAVPARVTT
jgi:hypothetical protein